MESGRTGRSACLKDDAEECLTEPRFLLGRGAYRGKSYFKWDIFEIGGRLLNVHFPFCDVYCRFFKGPVTKTKEKHHVER